MRVLFIGDPHLKINRFELSKQFITWLDQLIAENKPDLIVNLGDTFDTHAVLRSEVVSEFMAHVYRTINLGIPYVYLLGNHDMFKPNDATYHAMLPFKNKIKNLFVVDVPTTLFDMTFVPYQHNPDNFPRNVESICVAHQTFLGADYGALISADGVDPDTVSGCDLIVSGHIHKKQLLQRDRMQVLYVGSPFSQSASDVDQVKGITILDTATLEQEFFQTPLPSWRKLTLEVSPDFNIEDVHNSISSAITGNKDHWVVELSGPKAEITGYLNSGTYLSMVKSASIKLKTSFTDKEKKKLSIEAKTMEQIISEYVTKVYSGSLDKARLQELAKSVLSEARLNK